MTLSNRVVEINLAGSRFSQSSPVPSPQYLEQTLFKSLAITPRNLGCINLPTYCPRCLHYLLRMRFHPPFNHFGAAIFNHLQSCQEAILGYFLEARGSLPKAFKPFCDCASRTEYPKHWSKFSYTHKSGVVLYGAPDEILTRKDGTLCVIDHKTAHCKGDKDPFFGQYQIQVIGYADIAEGLELGDVSLGGLLYWEAQKDSVIEDPSAFHDASGLWVPFQPKGVEIEIDYRLLDPLLSELKKVADAKRLPEGREGCDDCRKLALLLAIHEEAAQKDEEIARKFFFDHYSREMFRLGAARQKQARRELLWRVDGGEDLVFAADGMISNWEFDPSTPTD